MRLAGIIEGLQIFAKHCDPDKSWICAEHDEIFAGHDAEGLTDDEKARLEELGWSDAGDFWRAFT